MPIDFESHLLVVNESQMLFKAKSKPKQTKR